MKRLSTGAVKPKGMVDLFGRPIKSNGTWDIVGDNECLIFTHNDCRDKKNVACFDLDGTLITTKSGKVFAQNTKDWKILFDNIPSVLKKLISEDYKLVLFTNQKGIQVGKVDVNEFKLKIEAIIAKLNVPIQAFVAIADNKYRKPSIGMWQELEKRMANISIDVENSVYVGDAAGRIKSKIRPKKDHSKADRLFAMNVGVKFQTPEEFFGSNKEMNEEWEKPLFEPMSLFRDDFPQLEPEDTKIPKFEKEVIVIVGFPGSGKSTFSKEIAKIHNYSIVNRDTLGTWQKCVAQMKFMLNEDKSVIVDNTNPDKESRRRYLDEAKKLNVKCRCFVMNCDLAQAEHNIKYRELVDENAQKIGKMILRMHNSKFQEPTISEGFEEIVHVNFKPNFQSEENKKVFKMYLTE